MSTTTPPSVTTLPSPVPTRDDSANFRARADAFLAALPTFLSDLVALAANVYANAVDAFTNATAAEDSAEDALASQAAAASSAVASATSAGAALWVSGGSYTANASVVYSPTSKLVYRAKTTHSGVSTDPSADATNWGLAAVGQPQLIVVSGTTQTASAGGHYRLDNVSSTTVTLPGAPSLGDIVWVSPNNGLLTNVIARNGNAIMGLSEDMTIGSSTETAQLEWWGGSIGWRLHV